MAAADKSAYGNASAAPATVWNETLTGAAGGQPGFRDGEPHLRVSSPSDGFHDLVGNLAELVIGAREDWVGKPGASTNLYAIGGSFASSPEIPVDKPVRLAESAMKIPFNDLGFRLVFECESSQIPQASDLEMVQSIRFLMPGE